MQLQNGCCKEYNQSWSGCHTVKIFVWWWLLPPKHHFKKAAQTTKSPMASHKSCWENTPPAPRKRRREGFYKPVHEATSCNPKLIQLLKPKSLVNSLLLVLEKPDWMYYKFHLLFKANKLKPDCCFAYTNDVNLINYWLVLKMSYRSLLKTRKKERKIHRSRARQSKG